MKDELSSFVLCNLLRPPDEPRLKIAQNGCETQKKEEHRKEKLIWDNFRDLRAAVNVPSFHPRLHSSVRRVRGGRGPGVVSGCAPEPLKKRKGMWLQQERIHSHLVSFCQASALLSALPAPRVRGKARIEHATLGKSSLPERLEKVSPLIPEQRQYSATPGPSACLRQLV